jgi:hypothetical protein
LLMSLLPLYYLLNMNNINPHAGSLWLQMIALRAMYEI